MKNSFLAVALMAAGILVGSFHLRANNTQVSQKLHECSVRSGLFYTVHLGIFDKPQKAEMFKNVEHIYFFKLVGGGYAYFTGIFDSRFDAMEKRYSVFSAGNKQAKIAAYYNGEKVTIAEADLALDKYGKAVLYNSVPNMTENFAQKEKKTESLFDL